MPTITEEQLFRNVRYILYSWNGKNVFLKGSFPLSPSHVRDVRYVGGAWQTFEREGGKGILGMGEARGAHEEAAPLKIHLCLNFNVQF